MPWQLGTTSDLFQTVRKHCARGVNHLLFHPWNKCKNWGRTKASNRSRTFVYISPIVCSLAIGLYLCLPGSDHPGCAGDLVENVKHCHPHHILHRRQREEKGKETLSKGRNKVVKDDTKFIKKIQLENNKNTANERPWRDQLKLIKRGKCADGCLIRLNIDTKNNTCVWFANVYCFYHPFPLAFVIIRIIICIAIINDIGYSGYHYHIWIRLMSACLVFSDKQSHASVSTQPLVLKPRQKYWHKRFT